MKHMEYMYACKSVVLFPSSALYHVHGHIIMYLSEVKRKTMQKLNGNMDFTGIDLFYLHRIQFECI